MYIGLILLSVLVIGIICIVLFFRHVYRSSNEGSAKLTFNAKQKGQIAFYEKCLEQNIHDLKTWANFQKAEQIAMDLNLAGYWVNSNMHAEDALKAYFEESKALYTQNIDIIKEKKLEEKKIEELKQEEQLTKYADCVGIYKRISMLSDLEKEYREGAHLLYEYSKSIVGGVPQKELDWAIIGGLVSGFAGGAAGAAAAVDAQIRNAGIRAQNARNIDYISNSVYEVCNAAAKLSTKADDLHGEIYDAEYKTIVEKPEDDIMDMLSFENSKIEFHETGSFSVSVSVKYKKPLKPIDGKNMVVDGTIAAELYQDGDYVESALLVLPAHGLTDDCHLKTICCVKTDASKSSEIKFVPYRLWLIEE